MEENKRRLFISGAGHPSAVLRAKKDETEEQARKRLTDKGWNMEAPHSFDDEKKEFRATDPKIRKRKKSKAPSANQEPEEAKLNEEKDEDKGSETGPDGKPAIPDDSGGDD